MNKYSLKFFSFFFVFFSQISAAFPVYNFDNDSIRGSSKAIYDKERILNDKSELKKYKDVAQSRPAEPFDKPIKVRLHTKETRCYMPKFVDNDSFVVLGDCSYSGRYDVFQRIALNVENVWLCLTAPGSVTGVDGSGALEWDYIRLRPCVTNDINQRWVIKGRTIYTADESYRIKDTAWYLYISKKDTHAHDHTIDPNNTTMDKWIDTISVPVNMSLKMFIGWKFITSYGGFNMYYLSNMGSKTDVYDFYYNPENGHIATYDFVYGKLNCMVSQQSATENSKWVGFKSCNDTIPSEKDATYWNVGFLRGGEGSIWDVQGNYLRVARYGGNWGVPYTAKPAHLKDDTYNSPTSEFSVSYDVQRWNNYVYSNLQDSLTYCPAPGHKQTVSSTLSPTSAFSKKRSKRDLPRDFELTEEWRERLYQIATSTRDSETDYAGICGTCLLHSYQTIIELHEYFPGTPFSNGSGYFFNTAANRNPMISFRERYPSVYNFLQDAPRLYGYDVMVRPGETANDFALRVYELTRDVVASMTQIMLPRYTWRASRVAMNRSAILTDIRQMLRASIGTMWIAILSYTHADGRSEGHAMPIIRGRNGLYVIPANVVMSRENFIEETTASNNQEVIYWRLSQRGTARIDSFTTLQLTGLEQNPLNFVMSQNNCTGEGEGRRGNKNIPLSATVNLCSGGRCSIQ